MNSDTIRPGSDRNMAKLKWSLCIIGIVANLLAVAAFFLDLQRQFLNSLRIDDCTFTSWLLAGWIAGLVLPFLGFVWPGKPVPVWLFLVLVLHYGAIIGEGPFALMAWAFSCGGPVQMFG